jgi:hypothetical protein
MGLDILKMTDGNQTTIQEGADSKKGGGRKGMKNKSGLKSIFLYFYYLLSTFLILVS